MKIVGLDADLRHTGVAVIQNGNTETCVIENSKQGPVRLIEIREQVWRYVLGAGLVLIEGYAFAAANQAHQMGELGGVLRVMFHELGLRWIEVAPSQVKKFATGKGNCPKDLVLLNVYKRWGKELATSHEADAFILAKIGEALLGKSDGLTVFQSEVIAELAHGKRRKKRKKAKGTTDAFFDNLRISSRARTDAEIADTYYASNASLPVDKLR